MTNSIQPLDASQAEPAAAAILSEVRRQFGRIPNVFGVMANAPAVLAAYAAMHEALDGGMLSNRMREQIAIAVAGANDCAYCLAAHRAAARHVGLDAAEVAAAERGEADNPGENAALDLAIAMVRRPGEVPADLVSAARAAGLDDRALLEIAGQVALNTLTNAVNRLARTPVDF